MSFGFQTAVSDGVPVYDAILVDEVESAASNLLLLSRQRLQVLPKRLFLCIKLHGVSYRKSVI